VSDATSAARPIVFVAGGTGGHIAPCLALAEAYEQRLGGPPPCWFICSDRGVDRWMLDPAVASGRIRGVAPAPAKPLKRTPAGLARVVMNWGPSVRIGRGVIRGAGVSSRSEPPVVVTTGGFVAPPAAQAARVERVPLVVIALDATPGKAGRFLARRAAMCLDASPGAERSERPGWETIAPLVRRAALPSKTPPDARRALGLDPDRPTLLVTGGSQGARSVNAFIAAHLEAHAEEWRAGGWQSLHLSGPTEVDALRFLYRSAGVPARVVPYLDAMGDAWSAADLHVGRAGAGTVSEAMASGTFSILMPYPYHEDAHQRENAQAAVDRDLGIIADDFVESGENLARHGALLSERLRAGVMQDHGRHPLPEGAVHGAASAIERILGA